MVWPVGAKPDQPWEAIAWFRKRVPMTNADFNALRDRAKQKAFKVAGIAQLDLIAETHAAITKALETGSDLAAFKKKVSDRLRAAWGFNQDKTAHRVETIFRTNVQSSYSAGRFEQLTLPSVLKYRPYWMLDTTKDQRQSSICKQLSHPPVVLPADDPWWDTHMPPLHFRCRSAIRSLRASEAEKVGVTANAPKAAPDKGFGRPPGDDDWKPDVTDYPPELKNEFIAKQKKKPKPAPQPKPMPEPLVPKPEPKPAKVKPEPPAKLPPPPLLPKLTPQPPAPKPPPPPPVKVVPPPKPAPPPPAPKPAPVKVEPSKPAPPKPSEKPKVKPEHTPAHWEKEYEHLGEAKKQAAAGRAAMERGLDMPRDEVAKRLKTLEGNPAFAIEVDRLENFHAVEKGNLRDMLARSGSDTERQKRIEMQAAMAGHLEAMEGKCHDKLDVDWKGPRAKGADQMRQGDVFFRNMVSKDLTIDKPEVKFGARSFYLHGAHEVKVNARAPHQLEHELMHALETKNRKALEASVRFLEARTKGERAVRLDSVDKIHRYKPTDLCKPDKLFSAYMGKVCPLDFHGKPIATELTSQGVEDMLNRPRLFYREDPETFLWLLGQLQGAGH